MTPQEYNTYWKENKSSDCLLLPKTGINSRLDLFQKDLAGKRVLHIGCSDWPDTASKLKDKNLLHQFIEKFARELWGLDSSKKGIEMMKSSGIENVFIEDVYNLSKSEKFLNQKFDFLVASETIEHLLNPGLALESIREYILKTNPDCKIIFTVPNYHNFFFNFLYGLRKREIVNPDHKFYFSYRTFRNLLDECGFEVDEFYFATYGKGIKTLKEKILAKTILRFFECMTPYLYFRCHIAVEVSKQRF